MKNYNILYIICALLVLCSCAVDNYDQPESSFTGRIVYEGDPIHVGYDRVSIQLWEPGWQGSAPIDVLVDIDGSFSALLFNASYKLIIPTFQGPWMNRTNDETDSDTILVNLNGSKNMDIEVLPYYMIRDQVFSVSGESINATCSLEKIITDGNARDVERVSLYLGKTLFTDERTSISNHDISGGDIADLNSIALSAAIPELVPAQDYVFARIGVKIAGVEDMLFSPVERVDFN